MSRSTWACELKLESNWPPAKSPWSRSTWACELKLFSLKTASVALRHAPRERVSWNDCYSDITQSGRRSRSTWACELKCLTALIILNVWVVTLHVSVWVEIRPFYYKYFDSFVTLHVSVWVEMHLEQQVFLYAQGHAPRERVSWNNYRAVARSQKRRSRSTWACELKFRYGLRIDDVLHVTLHVSVWVEMENQLSLTEFILMSRSTWACELKSNIFISCN